MRMKRSSSGDASVFASTGPDAAAAADASATTMLLRLCKCGGRAVPVVVSRLVMGYASLIRTCQDIILASAGQGLADAFPGSGAVGHWAKTKTHQRAFVDFMLT